MMVAHKEEAEQAMVGNYLDMVELHRDDDQEMLTVAAIDSSSLRGRLKSFLWDGGSVYDAWFSCGSNQVAQVLLTLPYSFSQLGMASGIVLQIFYGLLGSWTAYLISCLYVEYRSRKERDNFNFKDHVIQWFEVLDGLLGPYWRAVGLFFNCVLLLFGSVIQLIACGSNVYYINNHLDKRTWTYIFGACCCLTVFIPSFRNYRVWSFLGLGMTTYTAWYMTIAAVINGQFITFGFACTPLYFVWEKMIGFHTIKSILVRALIRLPVVLPIWFLAIIFPFFGPINSAVGALLVTFTVYIIPAVAHMLTYRTTFARENAVEKPPFFLQSWVAMYLMYLLNMFVVIWTLVVGLGFGGWASITNFVHQIDTFGLFAKCYQCPKKQPAPAPPVHVH